MKLEFRIMEEHIRMEKKLDGKMALEPFIVFLNTIYLVNIIYIKIYYYRNSNYFINCCVYKSLVMLFKKLTLLNDENLIINSTNNFPNRYFRFF